MKTDSNKKYETKNVLITGFIVLLLMLFIGWRFIAFYSKINNDLPSEMSYYQIEEQGMELLVPESWSKFKDLSGAGQNKYIIAEIGSSSTKSTIIIEKNETQSLNLNDLRQFNDQQIRGLSGIDLLSDTEKTIGKTDGILREYVFTRQLVTKFYNSHCYAWLFMVNDHGYIFTLCSEDKIWEQIKPDYLKIIESIDY